jgi:ketosteroid isomerase-like protein
MTPVEQANLQRIRDYLAAVEAGATGDALAAFYADDAVQVELPNRLNPNGGRSDLARMLQRAEQGRHLLRSQRYEIMSETARDHRVVIEAVWTGVLAIDVGTLAAGATMRAHFAIVFELVDGRIRHQRNYDCFEPW